MKRLSFSFLIGLLLLPAVVRAEGSLSWDINQKTVERGFEFGVESGAFIVALPAAALSQPATLTIAATTGDDDRLPVGWDIVEQEEYTFSAAEDVSLSKPLGVIFRYPADDTQWKQIFLWDDARKTWKPLVSSIIGNNHEVRASLQRSRARVALASNTTRHYQGVASWYPDRLTPKSALGVASNEYPIGTKLKVTNQDTEDTVLVTVVSRGPYVDGRIIDLTKTAFSKIAHPKKQGIIHVWVEPVKK